MANDKARIPGSSISLERDPTSMFNIYYYVIVLNNSSGGRKEGGGGHSNLTLLTLNKFDDVKIINISIG